MRSRFVEYTEKLSVSLKHLYLKDWTNSYETMPYPPAVGVYAIYHVDELFDHVNFAMKEVGIKTIFLKITRFFKIGI